MQQRSKRADLCSAYGSVPGQQPGLATEHVAGLPPWQLDPRWAESIVELHTKRQSGATIKTSSICLRYQARQTLLNVLYATYHLC